MTYQDSHEVALQDAWLRRVAKGLVSDTDTAEDLVQDAWVASLESSRRGEAARPWLGGVLRNRTFSLFRRGALRRERERDAGGPGETLPPDEIAEQLQMRERVARELGALDEPFRSALYLRFVEGLSVRATSQRLGIATSTAHTRIETGLARLRVRLDHAYEGDRRAWVMAVLPWARTAAPLAIASTTTLIMLALSAAAGAALFLAGVLSPDPVPTGVELASIARSAELLPLPSPELTSQPISIDAARSPMAAAPVVTHDPTAPAAQDEGATVGGRLFLPDGSPATGATWVLEGFPSNNQLVMDHGVPSDWTDPGGTAGVDGRFEFSFTSPRAFQYFLRVDHPDCVSACWRWGSIEAQETKGVGDVTLRAPGGIEGTVVDAQGTPLSARRWQVYATEADVPPDLGLQGAAISGPTDEGTACFAFDRLPEGPVQLKIYDRQLGWVKGPRVEIRAGETVSLDFPLPEMAEFANAVVVSFRMRPFHSFPQPSASRIWLVASDGSRRGATMMPGRSSGFLFSNVGPGLFRVEVDDPRLEAWSKESVEAGAYVYGELRGNAALAFDIEGPDGAAVDTYSVDISIDNATWSPSRFRAVQGDQPLAGGRYGGLHPGDYTVTVRGESGSRTTRVLGLQPGETRMVSMALTPAAMLVGRVVRPSGEPAVGVLVRTVTPDEVADSPDSFVRDGASIMTGSVRGRRQVDRGFTDENGEFSLAISEAPVHLVLAGKLPGPRAESQAIDTGPPTGPIQIVLPEGGRIDGSLVVPAGLEPSDWSVLFVRTQVPGVALPNTIVSSRVEASGAFSLGPLDEGQGTLVLMQGAGFGASPGVVPPNGRALGTLAIQEGQTLTPEYDYPGAAPVTLTAHLSGFGLAGPGPLVQAVLVPRNAGPIVRKSTATSTLGPLAIEPGTYDATFVGEGWLARRIGLEVQAGGPAELQVPIGLTARSVRFSAGGSPLVGVSLRVSNLPNQIDGPRVTTDADGAASLRLGPGSYTLQIESLEPELVFVSATFEWPLPTGTDLVEFE